MQTGVLLYIYFLREMQCTYVQLALKEALYKL